MTKTLNALPDGFTIGADPELFVVNTRTNKPVSAVGLIPGDKDKPFVVSGERTISNGETSETFKYGGAIQVDGLALEFNVDPCSDFDTFNNNIRGVMLHMNDELKKNGKELSFLIVPSVQFDLDYYDNLPDDAKILGCNPDNNAWLDGAENPAPNGDDGSRSAAGHIHIGWGSDIPVDHPEHIGVCNDFVKHLDNYAGLFDRAICSDNKRRLLYGRAGAHRRKSYGVEYRVPGNAWLKSRSRRQFMFNTVKRAIEDMTKGNFRSDDVQYLINDSAYAGKDGSAAAQFAVTGMTIPASCY
jgi:hypothetical protein